jgi:hypothetical protein
MHFHRGSVVPSVRMVNAAWRRFGERTGGRSKLAMSYWGVQDAVNTDARISLEHRFSRRTLLLTAADLLLLSACARHTGGNRSPGPPLLEVGLYSWDEVATYRAQVGTLGMSIIRVSGQLPDSTFAACLALRLRVMWLCVASADGYSVAEAGPSHFASVQAWITNYISLLDTKLTRFGPNGTYWKDNPTAPYIPIEAVEIGNENNDEIGKDPTSIADYAQLLVSAYNHIKASWATVKVVGFSAMGASNSAPGFISGVFAADPVNVPKSFDVLSCTMYTPNGDPPDQLLVESWGSWTIPDAIAEIKDTLAQNGCSQPFWISENGWQISQADGGYFGEVTPTVTLAQQAAYSIRMNLLCARYGLPRIYHFFVDDTDRHNEGYINNDSGTIRPVATALKHMISVVGNATSLTVIMDGATAPATDPFIYELTTPTGPVVAAWAQTPQTVSIPVSKTMTVTDMLGNVIATTSGSSYPAALTEGPIWLH